MPGTVIEVVVEAGQEVEAGTLLLTIESMKLQTAITAPHSARVSEVCVSAGTSFDQGAAFIRLESNDAEAEPETADSSGDQSR
jgi:biotin carboxyl carrier protein